MRFRFKLCTFDVTNTLLKFQIPVGEQYAKVGRIYGVERDPEMLTRAFLEHWKIMNMNHPNYGRSTGLTSQQWWKKIIQNVFSLEETKMASQKIDSISNHLYDLYKSDSCWKVTPGAVKLLTQLKDKGMVLGVISNFDERLDSVLCSTGLKSHFDFVLASYLVEVAKPNREIFDKALRWVPDLKPSDAIHIGDNVSLDYLAALEAGWSALLIANSKYTLEPCKSVNPKHIVQNLQDIGKYLLYVE